MSGRPPPDAETALYEAASGYERLRAAQEAVPERDRAHRAMERRRAALRAAAKRYASGAGAERGGSP